MDDTEYSTRSRRRRRSSRLQSKLVILLLLLLVINCLFIQAVSENAETKMPIIDAAKRLFSLPTSYDCWILKLKSLFFWQAATPHFSPPNSQVGGEGWTGEQGTTEKVKEAAVKSLDESKSAVEDSARSAAKLAEAAVEETIKKVKKTLSGKSEAEL
ncbi:Unknown protein [Striga hermonthica]|uniref:Uncharacterized protein n=1 Tax=Striga hermonthica TaxID=68872 RepID=A0A9N7MVJ6_STRHE|nr:Unknown protein [Striga hermonthica]